MLALFRMPLSQLVKAPPVAIKEEGKPVKPEQSRTKAELHKEELAQVMELQQKSSVRRS